MAVSDFLEKIGEGVSKGAKAAGRVAGAVLPAVGKGLAEEEAGYAPQIAAEGRQRQYAAEDAQIAAKEQELTAQLEMGRKYGTLTPEQQGQYVDAITQLYSHPRHAGTLMEKLRKAVHPNGAIAQPAPKLASAVPEGGTAAADEQFKIAQENRKLAEAEALAQMKAEIAAKYHKPAGKSPPLPGSQLPPDAVGADGQPISPEARNAGNSFVEWNGSWWPVAKPKPVFKTVKGHSVLVDAQSGAILRDLGPTGSAKVTTRQTLQPGDDGQMHLVNLTSITAPGGETIEVDPQQSEEMQPKGGEGKPPAAAPTGGAKPSRSNVGGILKPHTTGAKPVTPSAGKVVPGLSTLAKSKNPLFKSDVAQYTKVAEDANTKEQAFKSAQKAVAATPTPSSDQELIYAWVRSNVQGAGRMTQAEFKQAQGIGGWPLRIQNAYTLAQSGTIAPELRQQMLADIQRSYETSKAEAEDLRRRVETPSGAGNAPTSGGIKIIRDANGRITGIE